MRSTTQGWHTAEWGTWGWAETILKLIAIVFGILAFFQSNAASGLRELVIGGNPRLLAMLLLALLTLGAVVQLGARLMQQEIVSLIFAVLNLLGHAALLVALLRVPGDLTLGILFGVFYAVGGIVKVQFLRATSYTEAGASLQTMILVAWGMVAPYVLLVILLLV